MLFSTFEFIFVFLPIVVFVFFLIGNRGAFRSAVVWLVLCSFFFYGWWKPVYLALLCSSILVNYFLGLKLREYASKPLLAFGVAINLATIGYFKYANFFIDNLNAISGTHYHLETLILPLAISFFTFQQIAYLVDCYRRIAVEHSFLNYCLFVTFFPQLIAGPIVHHKEMLPQFAKPETFRIYVDNFKLGFTIFSIGLFKKVVLADSIAEYAELVFIAVDSGQDVSSIDAWCGALAYSFQLYFDFSGYSDMAIGMGRIFGIKLPLNFNSPYQSVNIIQFWRRWHITLSHFLRDYLYIPFGGNRKGTKRRYINLMATMLLGGLWHGAGWNFVVWGGLHGTYIIIYHAWQHQKEKIPYPKDMLVAKLAAGGLTFFCVLIAWVFFRAETFEGAFLLLEAMFTFNGGAMQLVRDNPYTVVLNFSILAFVAFGMKNVHQVDLRRAFYRYGAFLGFLMAVYQLWYFMVTQNISEFLYFNF
ncbi:MAG: MBOAT family protein [Planctomycetes bacterium]|nr:MBOAT family protein [Planctomycetota bacterium]